MKFWYKNFGTNILVQKVQDLLDDICLNKCLMPSAIWDEWPCFFHNLFIVCLVFSYNVLLPIIVSAQHLNESWPDRLQDARQHLNESWPNSLQDARQVGLEDFEKKGEFNIDGEIPVTLHRSSKTGIIIIAQKITTERYS